MSESNTALSLIQQKNFSARAVLLAQRLEFSGFAAEERLSAHPLTVVVDGGGVAVLFRHGVAVFFAVTDAAEQSFLARLGQPLSGSTSSRETEELEIVIDANVREGLDVNHICLAAANVERLQLVASVLSKSVVLAEYESLVTATFDRIEPLAADLQRDGLAKNDTRSLLRHIGDSLLSQHRMVGRAEIRDKPELLWTHPELEPLYLRLEDELEISERYSILDRKLELISRTAATVLELLHTRRGHRLEWYIVILIAVGIVLLVGELFLHG